VGSTNVWRIGSCSTLYRLGIHYDSQKSEVGRGYVCSSTCPLRASNPCRAPLGRQQDNHGAAGTHCSNDRAQVVQRKCFPGMPYGPFRPDLVPVFRQPVQRHWVPGTASVLLQPPGIATALWQCTPLGPRSASESGAERFQHGFPAGFAMVCPVGAARRASQGPGKRLAAKTVRLDWSRHTLCAPNVWESIPRQYYRTFPERFRQWKPPTQAAVWRSSGGSLHPRGWGRTGTALGPLACLESQHRSATCAVTP